MDSAKMKQMSWKSRYFIVITYFLHCYTASTVTWKRITNPIEFGNNVTLKCFISVNFNENYPRQWKRGSHLLTLNEATFTENRKKYAGSIEDDGFILIIKDFQPEDFRQNYTCSYEFANYTANLTTENYQCYPEEDSYKPIVSSSLSQIEVNITFQKIYPIPKCTIYLHGRELEARSVNTSHAVDMYCLGIYMTLSYEYGLFDCGEEASVTCSVGNSSFLLKKLPVVRTCKDVCRKMSPCLNNGTCVFDRNNVSCDCIGGYYGNRCEHFENQTTRASTTDPNKTCSPASTTMIVIIMIVVLVIVIIIVVVSLYIRRKCSPIEKTCEFFNSTICCTNTNEKKGRGNMNGDSSRHQEHVQNTPMINTEESAV